MGPPGIEREHGWTCTTIVAEANGSVVLRVTPTRPAVSCPTCRLLSRRRHSWYTRRAMDLPWRSASVRLRVRSRRWFCTNKTVRAASSPSGSKASLHVLLAEPTRPPSCWWSLACARAVKAGTAGTKSRRADKPRHAAATGQDVGPERSSDTARVGVDDFSLRCGTRYATVLIHLAT